MLLNKHMAEECVVKSIANAGLKGINEVFPNSHGLQLLHVHKPGRK